MLLSIGVFVLGLVVGSFLNVCIWRLPRRESLWTPRSHCPRCQRPIAFYDNIPVLSFLWLRARCRFCRQPISWRYPLVELANGLGYLLLVGRYGLEWPTAVYALLFSSLLVITLIDLDHQIIPDSITLPGIAVGLIASWFVLPQGLWNAVVGTLTGAGIFLFVTGLMRFWMKRVNARRKRQGRKAVYTMEHVESGGMGGGDMKFFAMIGAFMGWKGVVLTIFLGALTGAVAGLLLMLVFRMSRTTAIPFGPFLCLGAAGALFYGHEIIAWYQLLSF